MESSAVVAFRALVMLACLVVVPLAAIFGSAFPELVKTVLVDRLVSPSGTSSGSPTASDSPSMALTAEPPPPWQGASTVQRTGGPDQAAAPWPSAVDMRASAPGMSGGAPLGAAPVPAAVAASFSAPADPRLSRWPGSPAQETTSAAARSGLPPSDGYALPPSGGNGLAPTSANVMLGGQPTGPPAMATQPGGVQSVQPQPTGPQSGGAPLGGPIPANVATGVASLDPFSAMQKLLKQQGATYYLLETWGSDGELYRFHAKMSVAGNPNYTRHFEATDRDALGAMRNVVAQVEAWRAGRIDP